MFNRPLNAFRLRAPVGNGGAFKRLEKKLEDAEQTEQGIQP